MDSRRCAAFDRFKIRIIIYLFFPLGSIGPRGLTNIRSNTKFYRQNSTLFIYLLLYEYSNVSYSVVQPAGKCIRTFTVSLYAL